MELTSVSSTDRVLGSSGNEYNAVFTDKTDNSAMDQSDFLKLMVAQMQNQDFTNPMDNSDMINQMVQFSNMQQMQEMANYSKINYALGLVGKTVTASRYTVSGDLDTTTGAVEKISLLDDEYVIYVGGKKYTMSQIMSIGNESGSSGLNPQGFSLTAGETTASAAAITWEVPTEDELSSETFKYSVYYSKEGPFDTVEAVEKGTLSGSAGQKNVTEAELTDLEPGTTYYVNVVVEDSSGAKGVYQPVTVRTLRG